MVEARHRLSDKLLVDHRGEQVDAPVASSSDASARIVAGLTAAVTAPTSMSIRFATNTSRSARSRTFESKSCSTRTRCHRGYHLCEADHHTFGRHCVGEIQLVEHQLDDARGERIVEECLKVLVATRRVGHHLGGDDEIPQFARTIGEEPAVRPDDQLAETWDTARGVLEHDCLEAFEAPPAQRLAVTADDCRYEPFTSTEVVVQCGLVADAGTCDQLADRWRANSLFGEQLFAGADQ